MAYSNFLSQDEVDALLAGVRGEETQTTKEKESRGGVRPYDLSSPERVVRQRMQTLELINERFARRLRSTLLRFMSRNADISILAIKIQKYNEYKHNLHVNRYLNLHIM